MFNDLQALLPEQLVLAALDLLDRFQVVKYMYHGVAPQYRALGTTSTYTVFPDVGDAGASPLPAFCSCPSFIYAVLMSETHAMCKHILAVRLAHHFSMFSERPCTLDEIASISAEEEQP